MTEHRDRRTTRRRLGVAALLLLATTATALVATVGASARTLATTPNGVTIGTKCGDVPPATMNDLSGGLVKKLPAAIQGQYYGYQYKIHKSAYANWKPKGAPPYTVAIDYGPLVNPWNAYVYNLLPKFLKRSPLVKNVIAVTRRSNTDPTEALQTFNSMVAQKPDVIIALEGLSAVVGPAVEAAGKQGIPTISLINSFETPWSIGVTPNNYTINAEVVGTLLKALGGNANIFYIASIPGLSSELNSFNAAKATIAQCPGAKIVGQVNGFFSPPAVKGATLQFLATHPEKIDLTFTQCCMQTAALQAFLQAGRSAPAMADPATLKSFLGYWAQNKSTFKGAATAGGATGFADLVTRLTLRMLAGQGPKVSVIPWFQPLITTSNLSTYAKAGWTIDTPGTVENPKSTWYTKTQLDSFFSHPERTKGTNY